MAVDGAKLLTAAALLVAMAVGYAASLLPSTSAVFAALERRAAGDIVAVVFQRYAWVQYALLGAAMVLVALARQRYAAGTTLVVALMAGLLVLHLGWDANRRATANLKQAIVAMEQAEQTNPDTLAKARASFGILHGVSMVMLLFVLVLGLTVAWIAGRDAVTASGLLRRLL